MIRSQRIVGRYQLLGILGSGTIARVYRARDRASGREVALKVLRSRWASDPQIRQRFVAKAQALAQVRHRNVVRIYETGELGGRPYVALELINGSTLADLTRNGRGLQPARVVTIVKGAAAGIDALHRAGIVHKDITPSNIMVEQSSRVVIMDLGVAPDVDHTRVARPTVGTAAYLAPEQVRGERARPAADIYALGAVTYHLLAGRPPFMGNRAAVLQAQLTQAPPSLRQFRTSVSPALEAAVTDALAKNSAQRPVSAGQFASALAAAPAQAGPGGGVGPPPPPPPPPPPRRLPLPVLIGAGAGVLLVGAALAIAILRGGDEVRITRERGVVATLAGGEAAGHVNGPGASARFRQPQGVAVDGAGNLYVADTANHTIRRVTPAGDVADAAGGGQRGFAEGIGSAVRFWAPTGIAVDQTGNLYVADSENHRIRKIAPNGAVSTLAGSGIAGHVDGAGNGAQFKSPTGVAVDAAGVVYVADSGNRRIRRITPDGIVSTIAGTGDRGFKNGPANAAQFDGAFGIAVDTAGNLYVADDGNHVIRRITPDGQVETFAGSGDQGFTDGVGTGAQFTNPTGVAVDRDGAVYVTDRDRLRKIMPAGAVTTLAGGRQGFQDGPAATARFNQPNGVGVDRNGTVYVGDSDNHRIRIITPAPER